MQERNVPQSSPRLPKTSGDAPIHELQMLSALALLSRKTFSSTTECVETYLKFIRELIGVATTYVSRMTSEVVHIVDVYGSDACPVDAGGAVPMEETFCQYVRIGAEPVIVNNAEHDPRVVDVAIRRQSNIGAYLGVPLLLSDGSIYGTLCALHPTPRTFSQAQVDLMQMAATHVARLIERDQLQQLGDRRALLAEQRVLDAETALDEQTAMLQVVVHDIRSPLSAVRGYAELLTSGVFGALSELHLDTLNRIYRSAQFIHRLTTDLVDVAAIDSQTLMLVTEAFDPNEIARQAIESCQVQARMQDLELHLRELQPSQQMIGDKDRLQQVLLNLLSNALRYTEQGSVQLQIVAGEDGTIEFQVQDTGPGIPAEMLERIWQRHQRAAIRERGLGLGLYVVQRLTAAMNGTVGVRSTLGEGSVFWVRLPVLGPPPSRISWTM